MHVVGSFLSRGRSISRPSLTAVPFLLFSAIVAYSLFQPWTEKVSGRFVLGTSNGLHYWEGFVVLSLACAAAIMSLLPTPGGSASSRSRLLLVSTWMLVTLLWFRVDVIVSADPGERPPAAVDGGTGLNLALAATVALIGSVAWWKLSVVTSGLARSARASNRPTIFGARHEFSETCRFVLRRPEPVAIGAALILIAATQAWTLRVMDDQRGLHSIAGVVTIVAASALIGLAGVRLFLRLGDRTYFVAASAAAAVAPKTYSRLR